MKLLVILAASGLCICSVQGAPGTVGSSVFGGGAKAPDAGSPVMRQLAAQLGEMPIATAPARVLILAVKRVAVANPKDAAAIVAGVLSVERPEPAVWQVNAKLRGLGAGAHELRLRTARSEFSEAVAISAL